MLSLLGYPDAKLLEWKKGAHGDDAHLRERLDALFASVCEIIDQGEQYARSYLLHQESEFSLSLKGKHRGP